MNIWDREMSLNEIDSNSQIILNQSKSIDEFINDFGSKSDYHKVVINLINFICDRVEDGFIYHKDNILSYIGNNKLLINYKDLFAIWDRLYQFKYKFENIKKVIYKTRDQPWINQEIANTLNLKKELEGENITLSKADFAQETLSHNLETQVYDKIDSIKKSIKQLESIFMWKIMRSFDSMFENIYNSYLDVNNKLQWTRRSSKVARLFVDEFLKDDGIFTWDLNKLRGDLKKHFYDYIMSKIPMNKQNYRKIQETEWDRSFFKNQKTIFEKLGKEYQKNQREYEELFEDDLPEGEYESIRQDIIKGIYKIWMTQYFSKRDSRK